MTNLRAVSIAFVLFSFSVNFGKSANLTCYQCTRQVNEECNETDLKQCPSGKDRCVTHITKDAKNGFSIKRECGLGPCGFDDDMMNRGLGLDGCDRSKDEYFCLFCCRSNGCNKSSANNAIVSLPLFFVAVASITIYSYYSSSRA